MKKTAFIVLFTLLGLLTFSQQSFIPESLVINIEVPVRVFNNKSFIDKLTIKDFQLFENDIEQKKVKGVQKDCTPLLVKIFCLLICLCQDRLQIIIWRGDRHDIIVLHQEAVH